MSLFLPRGPYPPGRYDGPAGEVSALWRPEGKAEFDAAHDTCWV